MRIDCKQFSFAFSNRVKIPRIFTDLATKVLKKFETKNTKQVQTIYSVQVLTSMHHFIFKIL